MPEKLEILLRKIWKFPCKSPVFLLIVCVFYEGKLQMLTKTDPLPFHYLLCLAAAAVLLFFDRGLTIKACVVLLIANMALRDNYPFSHYPMYASFTDHTYYVFVAGKDDQPLALETVTAGIRTGKLKKPYDRDLDSKRKDLHKRKRNLTVEERREAGEQALAQVYRNCTPPARARLEKQAPIKLYHVDIYMHEGKVDERPPQFIAEIDLPPK